MRPELAAYWDFSIFLYAPFEITIRRMAGRDGGPADVHAIENRRYVEGQKLYLKACNPKRAASIVVNNASLESPEIAARVT